MNITVENLTSRSVIVDEPLDVPARTEVHAACGTEPVDRTGAVVQSEPVNGATYRCLDCSFETTDSAAMRAHQDRRQERGQGKSCAPWPP